MDWSLNETQFQMNRWKIKTAPFRSDVDAYSNLNTFDNRET